MTSSHIAGEALSFRSMVVASKERSGKFHVIKLKALLARLVPLIQAGYFKHSSESIIAPLTQAPAEVLIAEGSDFLWASLHHLYNAVDEPDELAREIRYGYFLQHAFDSYFAWLPVGAFVSLKNFADDGVPFPRLGLSLPSLQDKRMRLAKVSEWAVDLTYDCDFSDWQHTALRLSVDAVPHAFTLPRTRLSGSTHILLMRHQSLFDQEYFTQCCKRPFLALLLSNHLQHALALILRTDGELHRSITTDINYIVAVGNDLHRNPPSFSDATLKRSIFLSLDLLRDSVAYVAEMIIHEATHCELHWIQDTYLLVPKEHHTQYYSPWRPDPRPLLGLVHAIFVSHRIIEFYSKLLAAESEELTTRAVRDRVEILIHQVLIGVGQIDSEDLTVVSKQLLQNVDAAALALAEKLGVDLGRPPLEVVEHQRKWAKAP